ENIPKRAATDVRDSYVLFKIKANGNAADYHLAVKKSGETAPTPAQMAAGALKRNLSTTAINVLIAQRLDAPMLTYAEEFYANSKHTTLPTGMSYQDLSTTDKRGLIYDGATDSGNWVPATGSNAWVTQSVLESEETYTLYGMENGKTEQSDIKELATLQTDAPATAPTQASDSISSVDTTLEKDHLEIAIHKDEYYILPLQTNSHMASTPEGIQVYYPRGGEYCVWDILTSTKISFGSVPTMLDGQLLLFRSAAGDEELFNQTYILIHTAGLHKENNDPRYFIKNWMINSGVTTNTVSYSVLNVQ
ncbi:MAG: hypothetical protein AB2556_25090, partial [Candidatus Thiodiazotropha sp.]